MPTELEKKKRQRRDFMIKLYDETEGNENLSVVMYEIGEEIGLDRSETDQVTQYLIGEKLIELLSYDRDVRITHLGVLEVEASKENPQQPTQHFPAVNVINIGQMTNSQLQQGTHGSTQTGTFNVADDSAIQRFLEEFKRQLPGLPLSKDDHREVAGDVATVEAQLSSSRPKREIIGICLNAIKGVFAIPAVRDAASSELVNLMHQLPF